jgi:hypothetical protein
VEAVICVIPQVSAIVIVTTMSMYLDLIVLVATLNAHLALALPAHNVFHVLLT